MGLGDSVDVYSDQRGIPHVYADTWTDAARVLGYLHASDRLWQMDLLRRQASGTTAEIMGADALEHDIQMRRLGIRRGCAALWESGDLPDAFVDELDSYAEGVNARMRLMAAGGFGEPFASMGYTPEPWSPVDTLAFLKYMGWDQSGTADDLWLGVMVEKFGADVVEELWPIDRPYDSPQVSTAQPAAAKAVSLISPPPGSSPVEGAAPFGQVLLAAPGAESEARDAYVAALDAMQGALSERGYAFGSNNWAVSGKKTKSGKPILCSDPHLGFSLPSIWYAAHISVKGENVAGAFFPTSPHVVIGHNDHVGWGITNLQADAVDYFVETRHPTARDRYSHKGAWKTFETRTERIPVRGEPDHTVVFQSTVHGPVIVNEPETIAMQWTGFGPTMESVAFWRMNRAKNFDGWYEAAQDIVVPGINLAYADVHGAIALYSAGRFPKRAKGAGRVPMAGADGEHDWAQMIPADEMPLALNPASGFVASANARPADADYPYYLGWMWDVGYRHRRIRSVLTDARDVSVKDMRQLQYEAYDLAAARFLPAMLSELEGQDFEEYPYRRAIKALKEWDYRATVDSNAPAIWLRWLDHYRKAVWDAQWSARSMEKRSGSWGFSGINRREPILEVLEYLTREAPDSKWFDSPETSWTETRHDVALSSFITAMGTLERQFGKDVAGWKWGNTNLLRVNSLLPIPELRRTGDPVPGTLFTVNPGGGIGAVGSGASWRMIVPFAAPDKSIGVYPGGQSGDAASAHYADLMPVWARGDYVRLWAVGDADALPKPVRATKTAFTP